MKIAIVDDSPVWRERIRIQIQKWDSGIELSISEFSSGEALLNNRVFFEAVFLDVEMEGRDGFETALAYRDLYPESYILILTLHAELSRKGYLVNAFRYIDKACMEEEIPEALEALGILTETDKEFELRIYNEGVCKIRECRIICAETFPHGVLLHTTDRDFRAAVTIGELSSIVDPDSFFRSHNSWLINWKYVEKLQETDAVMKNGIRAMVSRKQLAEAKKRFWKYKFRRAHG